MRATQPLASRVIRLPLHTKSARKGYYKGNGVGLLGHWDKANPRRFVPDYEKIRTYRFPEGGLEGFKLTPFVPRSVDKFEQTGIDSWKFPDKTITGEQYLTWWMERGGHDEVAADQFPESPYEELAVSEQSQPAEGQKIETKAQA